VMLYGSSKPSSTWLKPTNEHPECQRCWQDGRTLHNGLYTHLYVRQAVPLVTDPGSNLLTTPPPYQRREVVPRSGSGASLCRCAMYSGPSSWPWVFEAAEFFKVPRLYARFCTWTSENSSFQAVRWIASSETLPNLAGGGVLRVGSPLRDHLTNHASLNS